MTSRRSRPVRKRIGRVSFYFHHGSWWVYYRDGSRPVRRKVGESQAEAEQLAARINAELISSVPTILSFQPISVPELRMKFLTHHEQVLRSSVGTVRRYRSATQHLADFAGEIPAHTISADRFALHLREKQVSPNGHPHTPKRRLRDKGVQNLLEICRSLYAYAIRMRHLPPYAENPFSQLRLDRMQIEDAKPVFVLDAESELRFLEAADLWAFPIHFTLAKTGLRVGELVHLLIEDLDLEQGWLQVRNKSDLGWKTKTRNERAVPLVAEVVDVLRCVTKDRDRGPVFLRHSFVNGQRRPALCGTRAELAAVLQSRIGEASSDLLSREAQLRVARTVWRDAGAVKADRIRTSFIRIAAGLGMSNATCPKSWRHSFATLLQDANVDPLIRQITLGHKPTGAGGELGMTAVYTHTRAATQRKEIDRAIRLWPESLAISQVWQQQQQGGRS
ncbi:tyrosine-type recombinase/integrase [Planctomicrobium sp. SH527]|uniref:tyrosine-type recombinase/integrase n=1 Tax=Planctomicrobium sp. SH527 TaxID=3448123 RepID=UPI003F5C36BD